MAPQSPEVVVSAKEKRTRRGAPKSRAGCNTWTRRIKCDETRPACLKCKFSGWDCPGYPPPKKNDVTPPRELVAVSTKAAIPHSNGAVVVASSTATSEDGSEVPVPWKNSLLDFPGTREEHRFFEFYTTRTAHDMEIQAENTNLYRLLGGPLGLLEKPIRHALIAMAATHADRLEEIESGKTPNRAFALTHYNKAITSLNKRLTNDKVSHQLTLIMCLLFSNIEALNKAPNISFTHVKSGAALLDGYVKRFGAGSMDEVDKKLSLTYAGYQIGGLASHLVSDDEFYMPMGDAQHPLTDSEFSSIDDAKDRLNSLLGWSFEPEIGCNNGTEKAISDKEKASRKCMINELESWSTRLYDFMRHQLQIPTREDLRRVRVLRIQNLMAIIENWGIFSENEMGYDKHINKFEDMISISEKLIEDDEKRLARSQESCCQSVSPSRAPEDNKAKTSAFQFEDCVAYPLAFVVEKCRAPRVRRRAIELLHRLIPQNKQASFYERVVQRIVEFEEGLCDSPVTDDPATWPRESQRIQESYHTPIYDHVKKTQTVLFEWQPGGSGTDMIFHQERIAFDENYI